MEPTPDILLLEDENSLSQIVAAKLQQEGLSSKMFSDGNEGLNYLKKQQQLPKAIYLDYHLLGLTGIDFMKALMADERLKNIPVIVVSNTAGADKIQPLLDLGAKKYIVKAESRLDDVVEEFIKYGKPHGQATHS